MTEPELPSGTERPISKAAFWAMSIVLAGMLVVSLHMNYVRWQRDKIEKVIVTPIPPPAATSSPVPGDARR